MTTGGNHGEYTNALRADPDRAVVRDHHHRAAGRDVDAVSRYGACIGAPGAVCKQPAAGWASGARVRHESCGHANSCLLASNMDWLAAGAIGYSSIEAAIYGVHGRVWGDCWEAWYQWLGRDLGLGYMNQWNQEESFVNYLTCPAAPHRPPNGQAMANTTHIYGGNSYGLNTAVLGDTGVTGANQWGFPNPNRPVTGWPGYGVGIPGFTDNRRKLARIIQPGDTILVAEHAGADHWLLGNTDNPFAYWSDAPFVRPPVDNSGTELTPPVSWGSWLPAYGWRDTYARSLALRVAHRGRSNYLFHDGHVAALTPWETTGPDPAQPNLWTGNAP